MPSYAAIRTDRSQRELILRELNAGRLRQGWGWEPYHDLRSIRGKRKAGNPLTDDERSSWLNRRLYEETWDGLQAGDIVLLPNLPGHGTWLLARITGPYDFDRSNGCENHGHVRPVAVVRRPDQTLGVIHPTDWRVPAGLRRSMRTQRRMWSLDQYGEALEDLLTAIEHGEPTDAPTDVEERFDRLADDLRAHASTLVDHAFGGPELEHVVVRVLRAHYRSTHLRVDVQHMGGPAEHGIDALIRLRDPLGIELHVGVQVKKHEGTEWSRESLEQLRRARSRWGIHAGVVVTTAQETHEAFDVARNELEDELQIPIRVLMRDELIDLLLAHLDDGSERGANQ